MYTTSDRVNSSYCVGHFDTGQKHGDVMPTDGFIMQFDGSEKRT